MHSIEPARPRRAWKSAPSILAVGGVILAILLGSAPARAQSFHDTFAEALTVSNAIVQVTGTTLGATAEPGEPAHHGSAAAHSVWLRVETACEGLITVRIANPGPGFRIAAYRGIGLANLEPVFSSVIASVQPEFQARIPAGTLHLAVDTVDGDAAFVLEVTLRTFFLTSPAQDFRAPAPAVLTLTVTNANPSRALRAVSFFNTLPFSRLLGIRTNPPWSLTFTNVGGTNVLMANASFQDGTQAASQRVTTSAQQRNDFLADATVIPSETYAFNALGSAAGATAEAGEPAHAGAAAYRSVWWRWTPLYRGPVVLSQPNPAAAGWLVVYQGTGFPDFEASATVPPTGSRAATFEASSGTTYWVAFEAGSLGLGEVAWSLRHYTLGLTVAGPARLAIGVPCQLIVSNLNPTRSLQMVELLESGVPVGRLERPPFEFQFTPDRIGTLQFSAWGTDNRGGILESLAVVLPVMARNDDLENALGLSGDERVLEFDGFNGTATAQPNEPAHGGSAAARSLWWTWTPRYGGMATWEVRWAGSGRARLAVYTGDGLGDLTRVAPTDLLEGPGTNRVVFPITAGTRYWMTVDGVFGDPSGAFHATLERHTLVFVAPAPGSGPVFGSTNRFEVANLDPESAPELVELLLDGAVVGSVSSPPYQWLWPGTQGGKHTFQARATHPGGEIRLSVPAVWDIRPANDDQARAEITPDPSSGWIIAGTTEFATWEPGEADARTNTPGTGSVWYRMTLPESRTYTLSFIAPTGTIFEVLGRTAASGTGLLDFEASANRTYQLRVSRKQQSAVAGPFSIELFPPPPNDHIAQAVVVEGTQGSIEAAFRSASRESFDSYRFAGTLWWRWTAPASGELTLDASGSDCSVVVGVYTGSPPGPLTLLGTVTNLLSFPPPSGEYVSTPRTFRVREGRIYHIALGAGYNSGPSWGTIRATYSFKALPQLPLNDDLANRSFLAGSGVTAAGDLTLATREDREAPGLERTLWWEWTAPQDGLVRIWVSGQGFTPSLHVSRGTDYSNITNQPALVRLPLSSDISSELHFFLHAGESVVVSVSEGWATPASAPVTLRIESVALPPPPDNDDFARATPILVPYYRALVNKFGSTLEPSEPALPAEAGLLACGSLWWQLAPTRDGILGVTLDACSDNSLALVFRGSQLASLQPLGSGKYYQPLLIPFQANEELRIAVVGPLIDTNEFALTVDVFEVAPANDDFAKASRLEGTNANVHAHFPGATREPGEPIHFPGSGFSGQTLWWSWVPPTSGLATIAENYGSYIAVYRGTSLSELNPIRRMQAFAAKQDAVYYLVADRAQNASALLEFSLTFTPFPERQPHDHFAEAMPLMFDEARQITLAGATREPGEPRHGEAPPGQSIWFRWTAPHNARASVNMTGSLATNISLAAYTGDTLSTLVPAGRGIDELYFLMTGGVTYSIAAEADVENDGEILLRMQMNPPDDRVVPVPGNLVQNPSFEIVDTNRTPTVWQFSGGYSLTINGDCPDGRNLVSLWSTTGFWGGRMTQSLPTRAGQSYLLKLAVAGRDLPDDPQLRLRFGDQESQLYHVPSGWERIWFHWPEFVFTATSAQTLLTIEVAGGEISIDKVSVVPAGDAPVFVTRPQSRAVFVGEPVQFLAAATGASPLGLQWRFNGNPLEGERSPVLFLPAATVVQAGDYSCQATNPFGEATTFAAKLVVDSPEETIILLQPESAFPQEGDHCVMAVIAVGPAPLRYQWFKEDHALPGQTNRHLVFQSFAANDRGRYHVTVSAGNQTIVSRPAHLTPGSPQIGGGSLRFDNQRRMLGPAAAAPVFHVDGVSPLTGPGFQAQLYAGLTLANLRPAGQPQPFLTDSEQGMFNPVDIVLPSVPPATRVFAQVRAWRSTDGASFEEACAAGGLFGQSTVFQAITRPNTSPGPTDGVLLELTSFPLQAGPASYRSGLLCFQEQALDGFNWTLLAQPDLDCVIERRIDAGPWVPWTTVKTLSGRTSFRTPLNPKANAVLFRVAAQP